MLAVFFESQPCSLYVILWETFYTNGVSSFPFFSAPFATKRWCFHTKLDVQSDTRKIYENSQHERLAKTQSKSILHMEGFILLYLTYRSCSNTRLYSYQRRTFQIQCSKKNQSLNIKMPRHRKNMFWIFCYYKTQENQDDP